jgi:hypothetical protein
MYVGMYRARMYEHNSDRFYFPNAIFDFTRHYSEMEQHHITFVTLYALLNVQGAGGHTTL